MNTQQPNQESTPTKPQTTMNPNTPFILISQTVYLCPYHPFHSHQGHLFRLTNTSRISDPEIFTQTNTRVRSASTTSYRTAHTYIHPEKSEK